MIPDDGGKGRPPGPPSVICSVGLRVGRGWLTLTSTWEGSRWVSDVDMGPHVKRMTLEGQGQSQACLKVQPGRQSPCPFMGTKVWPGVSQRLILLYLELKATLECG